MRPTTIGCTLGGLAVVYARLGSDLRHDSDSLALSRLPCPVCDLPAPRILHPSHLSTADAQEGECCAWRIVNAHIIAPRCLASFPMSALSTTTTNRSRNTTQTALHVTHARWRTVSSPRTGMPLLLTLSLRAST
jgi:hypothetical protein